MCSWTLKSTPSPPAICHVRPQVCKPGHGISDEDEDVSYGARVCHECPAGEYSFGGVNAQCEACPGETTNDKRGATGPDECDLCKPGMYMLAQDLQCLQCTVAAQHQADRHCCCQVQTMMD